MTHLLNYTWWLLVTVLVCVGIAALAKHHYAIAVILGLIMLAGWWLQVARSDERRS